VHLECFLLSLLLLGLLRSPLRFYTSVPLVFLSFALFLLVFAFYTIVVGPLLLLPFCGRCRRLCRRTSRRAYQV
jgi:hypothetical protein